jgi:hypothetical protein
MTNLQLELTNEKDSKNLLLELDEQELNRLIDEMTKIEQVISRNKKKFEFLFLLLLLSISFYLDDE